jgi:hypothetical protein
MAITPFDDHWLEYHEDAMSIRFVKGTLEPGEPFCPWAAALPGR